MLLLLNRDEGGKKNWDLVGWRDFSQGGCPSFGPALFYLLGIFFLHDTPLFDNLGKVDSSYNIQVDVRV